MKLAEADGRRPSVTSPLLRVLAVVLALSHSRMEAASIGELGVSGASAGIAVHPVTGDVFWVIGTGVHSLTALGPDFEPVAGAVELTNIVAGTDCFWISDPSANTIWKYPYFSEGALAITPYVVPTPNAGLGGLCLGPDGNLWFTEISGNKIGRLTPGGSFTEFPVPTANSSPFAIATGFDRNLYFVEYAGNKIGRITPGGVITEYPIPTAGSHPSSLAATHFNVVFTESGTNKIGYFDTAHQTFLELAMPTAASGPWRIVLGADRYLYCTERFGNRIARVPWSPNEPIVETVVPTAASQPLGIARDLKGDIWFTEFAGQKIGRLRLALPGDANADGKVDVIDVFYLIGFLFASGPAPK
jgi:streptogramin lyase